MNLHEIQDENSKLAAQAQAGLAAMDRIYDYEIRHTGDHFEYRYRHETQQNWSNWSEIPDQEVKRWAKQAPKF